MENKNHSDQNRKLDPTNFSAKDSSKIEERRTRDLEFDQAFNIKFNDHEITPPKQVWEKVRKKLPLNLYIKRQLNWLSKIAAVLMIGMLISVLVNKKQDRLLVQNTPSVSPSKSNQDTPAITPDFVFELEEKQLVQNKRKKKKKRIRHSPDLEELWAEILEEKDIPEEDALIANLIGSIESLPLENTMALVPPIRDFQELISEEEDIGFIPEDIEIRIPLKIESSIRVD